MAESFTRASGRYLEALGARRGLCLDEVTSLWQVSPEPLDAGYHVTAYG